MENSVSKNYGRMRDHGKPKPLTLGKSSPDHVKTATTLGAPTIMGKIDGEAQQEISTIDTKATAKSFNDDSLFGSLVNLPLSKIDQNNTRRTNNRSDKPSSRLSESIKDVDVLHPILVRQCEERFTVVCGNRRVEACRKLKRETIPARILNANVLVKDEYKIQLIENVDREDFRPVELARAIFQYCLALRPELDLAGMINLFNNYERKSK